MEYVSLLLKRTALPVLAFLLVLQISVYYNTGTGDASLPWVHWCGLGASSSFIITEDSLTSSLHLGFKCLPKHVYAMLSSVKIIVLHRAKGVT